MANEPSHCDRTQRPLPDSLTRLLGDPKAKIQNTAGDGPTVSLFDLILWWGSVAMFTAAALVFVAALTVAQRPL
ncbi:hypothetical protein MKK67_20890 [Methylobacterium sp. J-072]|uniref:hypothetical protein n=1 Tax=Methylobacterium sp. J-072 TaxID=2836651 RepID=UPI001FB9F5A2|nr:hypothetical protein [Methylobacterium sp. J-072]MCJ2094938.1 hypothetical protein [Methylobacterium sp. J-072]